MATKITNARDYFSNIWNQKSADMLRNDLAGKWDINTVAVLAIHVAWSVSRKLLQTTDVCRTLQELLVEFPAKEG